MVTKRGRRDAGIPRATRELTHTFRYNDLASVEEALDDDTAAVILEPTVFEAPKPGFLEGLRALCTRRGALLIFDEMWTGFRMALGGAQERYGVRADLAVFSKAIANGMPLSVLTGRAEVMRLLERDVFFFTTFGGEALSLAAARATMEELRAHDVPAHLARQGRRLAEGYHACVRENGLDEVTGCIGWNARSMITFAGPEALLRKSYVQQEMIARGVLWGGFHNLSYSHGEAEIAAVLGAYREVLPMLRDAIERGDVHARLRGEPVEPVFRKTTDFHVKPRSR